MRNCAGGGKIVDAPVGVGVTVLLVAVIAELRKSGALARRKAEISSGISLPQSFPAV
jgi:hypothetical protein